MRKMKNTLTTGTIALLALAITSCGSKLTESDVKLESTNVKGTLSDNLEVVDASYKITPGGSISEDYVLSVKFKSIEATDQQYEELHTYQSGNHGGMSITVMDTDGQPIAGLDKFQLHYGSKDALKNLLENEGEEDFLKFTADIEYTNPILDDGLPDNIGSLMVRSELTEYDAEEAAAQSNASTSSSSSSTSSSGASYSSTDIDAMLDSYDDYTDEYITFYKKAMNGDAAALSEYPALMEKAQEFADKLEAAEGDLNGDQLARMMEIQQKMMSAMSGG